VSIITNDGRNIIVSGQIVIRFSSFLMMCAQGHLKGYDQAVNIILERSHERVFSEDSGVEQNPLGLYIIRGDNM
jgi:U6 snRNA-associated Sm-like protein LSm8